ncbi:Hypothetical predicted protein [Octopus vulgaris]|uniref:Uncharacterized protein n=1 Tax=Octopus vulgaris TaxID=6645 RepID=A0AA36C138_OCTVU|nr:Hypothetical predicted protein [Octopus vulgaris]
MDVLKLLFCVLSLCSCFTRIETSSRVQLHKIIQSVNVVLNESTTLQVVAPNMRRPVVWRCDNHRYECDGICTNSSDFKVTQSGNASTLWIRRVTKDCLSWKFCDYNRNIGNIDLNINDNGALCVSATLLTEIPNMKRPVVWKYMNYKYECDRTCANGPEYRVTHKGNVSTLWIRNVTKERLDWKFEDDNLNYRKFDLKINSLTKAETYNITQNESAVLGGSTTLLINVPKLERIIVWKNKHRNLECDTTCYDYEDYTVNHINDISTVSIRNISESDFSWSFCDKNHCSPDFSLAIKGDTSGASSLRASLSPSIRIITGVTKYTFVKVAATILCFFYLLDVI